MNPRDPKQFNASLLQVKIIIPDFLRILCWSTWQQLFNAYLNYHLIEPKSYPLRTNPISAFHVFLSIKPCRQRMHICRMGGKRCALFILNQGVKNQEQQHHIFLHLYGSFPYYSRAVHCKFMRNSLWFYCFSLPTVTFCLFP